MHLCRYTGLEYPGGLEFFDVLAVNILEWAESPAGIIPAVHQPVVGRLLKQALLRHRLKRVGVQRVGREKHQSDCYG